MSNEEMITRVEKIIAALQEKYDEIRDKPHSMADLLIGSIKIEGAHEVLQGMLNGLKAEAENGQGIEGTEVSKVIETAKPKRGRKAAKASTD